MDSNGIANMWKDLEEGGETRQEVQKGFGQTLGADVSAELDKSVDEQFDAGAFDGAEDQRTSSLEVGSKSANEQFDADSFDGAGDQKTSSLLVENKSLDEQLDEDSTHGADHQRENLQRHSSVLEISQSSISPSPWTLREKTHCESSKDPK
uniref:Putative sterol 3-beta-glucosyltransferase UGT80B1-like isoform X2 n=1 Tax=Davidia involucrata TaxID=16924 RepID=A0A5B7BJR5_DAVIN